MHEVGLTRHALLALVHLGREHVGALEQGELAGGVVFEDSVSDVVEAEHRPGDHPWGIGCL
jgi:hypothetical protein